MLGFGEQKKNDSDRNTNEETRSCVINSIWAISGVWKSNEEKIVNIYYVHIGIYRFNILMGTSESLSKFQNDSNKFTGPI